MKDRARPDGGSGSALYRGYVLALLTAVYFFYLLDRNVVLVTQELLKAEFGLTDTQLGLMTGTVFAISFSLAGLPIGWAVDRVNRRRLLALAAALWSGLTALCGIADGFRHLLLARIGVAAAESAGSPTSLSLLSDLYPPERRSSAASIFYAGSAAGVFVSFLAGGVIAAEFGWRAVFLICGVPGMILAVLVLCTIKDPSAAAKRPVPGRGGLLAGLAGLFRDPVLVAAYLGATFYTLSLVSVGSWLMSFLARVHGADLKLAGLIIACTLGGCGLVGAVVTGRMADLARRRAEGGPLWVLAGCAIVNMTFGIAAVMAGELWLAVAGLCLWGATSIAYSGPINAVISQRAPAGAQGLGFAVYAILTNLIGSGLGPVTAGMVSDLMSATYGQASIRPALVVVLLVQILAVTAFVTSALLSKRGAAAAPPQARDAAPTVSGADI